MCDRYVMDRKKKATPKCVKELRNERKLLLFFFFFAPEKSVSEAIKAERQGSKGSIFLAQGGIKKAT